MPPKGTAATALPKPIRFHLVDGLRGLAALAVLGFHLNMPVVGAILGGGVRQILAMGWLGVQVFFVLSGFVVAHSLRRVEPSAAFIGRFVLRRSIRLDPPYWATLALALISILLSNLLFTERQLSFPTAGAIAAHLVYLQEILGHRQIVDVFWTLCLELQMYLVFVTLLTAGEAMKSRVSSAGLVRSITVATLGALVLFSFWSASQLESDAKTWFFAYWYQFFAGALTYWVSIGRAQPTTLAALITGCLVLTVISHPPEPLVTCATALVLILAARLRRLESWLSPRPFRWLGGISYSLYLIHTLLISRGWNGLSRLGLTEGNEILVLALLGLAAIAASDLWSRAFELPALRWSHRIVLLRPRELPQSPEGIADPTLEPHPPRRG